MPEYEYVRGDGKPGVLTEWHPMEEAPPLGSSKVVDGVLWVRVLSSGIQTGVRGFQPFMDYQRPPIRPGEKPICDAIAPDPKTGEPRRVFTRRETNDRANAAQADAGGPLREWD